MSTGTHDLLRLDRWLWYARFFKTRSLASKAVAGGHVKVNGQRVKPGHPVKPGDRLEIVKRQQRFLIDVKTLPERRGPGAEARAAYVEDAASERERQALSVRIREDRRMMPQTDGRPDKHTRRLLRNRKTTPR